MASVCINIIRDGKPHVIKEDLEYAARWPLYPPKEEIGNGVSGGSVVALSCDFLAEHYSRFATTFKPNVNLPIPARSPIGALIVGERMVRRFFESEA